MKLTADLSHKYEGESKAIQGYAHSVKTFSEGIRKLFSVEAPDSVGLITPICDLLDELAATNQDFAARRQRVSDDIRDIAERYAVLERAAADRRNAAKALESAKAKLKSYEDEVGFSAARKDFNRVKAEMQLAKLQQGKKEALARGRDATIVLINEKKRFAYFMFRRTRHAFTLLGQSMYEAAARDVKLLTKTVDGLRKARAGEVLADTSIEDVELAIPQKAQPPEPEKPEPEPVADVVDDDAAVPVSGTAVGADEEPQPIPTKVEVTAKNAILFQDDAFEGIVAAPRETQPGDADEDDKAADEPKKLKIFEVEPISLGEEPVQHPKKARPVRLVQDEPEKPLEAIFDLKAEGIKVPAGQQSPKKRRPKKDSPFDDV
jgi:hypothetical protein